MLTTRAFAVDTTAARTVATENNFIAALYGGGRENEVWRDARQGGIYFASANLRSQLPRPRTPGVKTVCPWCLMRTLAGCWWSVARHYPKLGT